MTSSLFDVKKVSRQVGEQTLSLEVGKLARQAEGAVLVRYAGNAMLVTVCMGDPPADGDFFPLTVNYQEKFYAAGKIPGGYLKREGRPSDMATLMARQIDRPLRPLFPKGFRNEVQIVATILASDMDYTSEAMGIIGASAALAVSRIPVTDAAGGVKIIWSPDQGFKINPKLEDIEHAALDLMVAGTREGICMVEGAALEVSEDVVLEALTLAEKHIIEEIELIEELQSQLSVSKLEIQSETPLLDAETRSAIRARMEEPLRAASNDDDKHRRKANVDQVFQDTLAHFEIGAEHPAYKEAKRFLEEIEVDLIRKQILAGVRTDGRRSDEIRPIEIELDLFNAHHGSALFTRGQTQSLGVVTLGGARDVKYMDTLEQEESLTKRFMLHYNFPPFSVGEVKRMGVLSRREIGHGHLAERALSSMLPDMERFPYTVRFVSEITESNGSSSMASVCSGSLALMAAGVPIKTAIAGIAMGLIWDKDTNQHMILSDIQGLEDHHGDMDFKVTGTANGVTAFQMDLKTIGLPAHIMKEALLQAKQGREHILKLMNAVIEKPRPQVAASAPKLRSMKIDEDTIGQVIGSGGKVIKRIMADTDTTIEINDDGQVIVLAKDTRMADEALRIIAHIVKGFDMKERIEGTISRVEPYGVFVDLVPGITGLLHVSRMRDKDKLHQVGDKIQVLYMGTDHKKRVTLDVPA